jgi:hypothetical protein
MYLLPGQRIKDVKLPAKIRCELARKPDIHSCQKILVKHRKFWLENTGVILENRTKLQKLNAMPFLIRI